MTEGSDEYQAYMLRLWRTQRQGMVEWCASLESPHTGERQSFASLEQLFAFLSERCQNQTAVAPDAGSRVVR